MTWTISPRRSATLTGYPRPYIDFDFAGGKYRQGEVSGSDPTTFLAAARVTAAYAQDLKGDWLLFATLVPRITNAGLRLEGSRTNNIRHNRDGTNAVWVKTNVTATKNQVGFDGAANGATLLAATANNGTCLQTVTATVNSRIHSAFVKRVSGTGTVEFTEDGSTWIPLSLTSSYSRIVFPMNPAITNPVVGFRIGTSGDSIAFDMVQSEITTNDLVSSPIQTGASNVNRGIDIVSLASFPSVFSSGSLSYAFDFSTDHPASSAVAGTLFFINNGVNERMGVIYSTTKTVLFQSITGGSTVSSATFGRTFNPPLDAVQVAGTLSRDEPGNTALIYGGSIGRFDRRHISGAVNNQIVQPTGFTALHFGCTSSAGGTTTIGSTIRRFRLWREVLPIQSIRKAMQ